MKAQKGRCFKVLSENETVAFSIESIGREGKRLALTGRMMGAWKSKMYIDIEEISTLFRLMFNLSFISYVLLLPFLYFDHWRKKRKSRSDIRCPKSAGSNKFSD